MHFAMNAFKAPTLFALTALLAGCNFAPKYDRPPVQTPSAYKELAPESRELTNVWKTAQPSDTAIRGKWWEVFDNSELNGLEDQVAVSNLTVAVAFEFPFRSGPGQRSAGPIISDTGCQPGLHAIETAVLGQQGRIGLWQCHD